MAGTGFRNGVMVAYNVNFSGTTETGEVVSDGQLLIGSTAAPYIKVGTLTAGNNVSITNGSGSITIAASAGIQAYTPVNTTPYVVLTSDYTIGVDCSGGIRTVQLPNAPSSTQIWVIKDVNGAAATNNITVTTVGGAVLIDDAATYTMNVNYGALTVQWNGTKYMVI